MDGDYVPISCALHDRLLDFATFRRRVRMRITDPAGERWVEGRIEDVYTRAGAEYLRLEGGEEIRLDRLLEVDLER